MMEWIEEDGNFKSGPWTIGMVQGGKAHDEWALWRDDIEDHICGYYETLEAAKSSAEIIRRNMGE